MTNMLQNMGHMQGRWKWGAEAAQLRWSSGIERLSLEL